MAQGLWEHCDGTIQSPYKQVHRLDKDGNHVLDKNEKEVMDFEKDLDKWPEWEHLDNMALGNLVLWVVPSIQQDLSTIADAETAWKHLNEHYGQPSATSVFKDFKEALNIRIDANKHPNPQIEKMNAAFQHLAAAGVEMHAAIKAMILLAAIPPKWDSITSIAVYSEDLETLTFSDVRDTILAHYEQERMRGKGGNGHQQANKISAVKRKRGNPQFNQQQGGHNQQQQQQQQNHGQHNHNNNRRGKRGGRGKGKEKAHEAQEHSHVSHIAMTATLPPPSSTTVAHVGPSGVNKRRVVAPLPKRRTEGPYKALNEALDLAERLEVPATIETTKTLEQRITEQYKEGPWSQSTNYMDDDEGSDIVDMSVVPPGKEDQMDWVAEGSYTPPSPGEEPLDWGSDPEVEEYVCSTSLNLSIHSFTASPQLLKGHGSKDGSSSKDVEYLEDRKCEHGREMAFCTRCTLRDESRIHGWLLDSGATAHFTNNLDDFIDYEPYNDDERPTIQSANTLAYAEGHGTVLVKHFVGQSPRLLRLTNVIYASSFHSRLLSMTLFLLQGLRVEGDARRISLLKGSKIIFSCFPAFKGDRSFWLHKYHREIVADNCVYAVNYDLMHRHLGHPSKDVLSHARDNTNNFPSGIKIPSESPVCPGCAQGKMPAGSHPHSESRATAPFERVHSDIKSLPVESYHKYKYFITFIDDYTSCAWVVHLCKKSVAIEALNQFLALVKTQYKVDVKEWMSDAGGEYKSDAFIKTLKDVGIKILQSAPHTPQQNGRAERFMHTVMDKAEAMRLEACLPDSWWEFAVTHAVHVYNRTPVRRLEWKTPYELLNGEKPEVSHLRVFGCGAYVRIPPETRQNKLSPKSELMIYLGHTDGIKAFLFMRLKKNTLFNGPTALFDETLFPKCDKKYKSRPRGTTWVNAPLEDQPIPIAIEDTTPGDDDPTPEPTQREEEVAIDRDDDPDIPSIDEHTNVPDAPPSPPQAPEPAPLRRSQRLRKAPTRPGNVYGEGRHPTEIEKDVRRTRNWKQMTENPAGSSQRDNRSGQPEEGAAPPGAWSETPPPAEDDEEGEVEELIHLAQEGGVKFQDFLLAKAVPLDPESPSTADVREWTFKDILKMDGNAQKEWKQACCEELESLCR